MPKLFNRRQFFHLSLGSTALAWLASVLYPITRYIFAPPQSGPTVNRAKVANLSDLVTNSGKIVKFGRKPALLVHQKNGNFKAFSAKCTHLDCLVQYKPENQTIWCACHNGVFDVNGKNISGPPPKPLEEFAVQVEGDDVIISQKN